VWQSCSSAFERHATVESAASTDADERALATKPEIPAGLQSGLARKMAGVNYPKFKAQLVLEKVPYFLGIYHEVV
jgi:hypothetical protein